MDSVANVRTFSKTTNTKAKNSVIICLFENLVLPLRRILAVKVY